MEKRSPSPQTTRVRKKSTECPPMAASPFVELLKAAARKNRRRAPSTPGAMVAGWTPDGKILYATYHFANLPDAQLVPIDPHNHFERIALSQATQGDFNPHTGTLFFTRLHRQSSFTKRYAGGSAENIWKYSPGHEAIALTSDYAGTS